MISQFYVLSPRGDTIINRDFRGDIVKGTAEIFFRKVKFWSGDAPPVFCLDGITYIFLKRNGLYFVSTTQQNVSASYCLELLQQMTKIFKDFCGVLTEEAIRRNFVLIYEILDEILDFGYPQHTTTESLKQCVHNEAVLVDPLPGRLGGDRTKVRGLASVGFPQINPKTVPSNASHRPVGAIQSNPTSGVSSLTRGSTVQNKNEVFVDILERLTVVMNSAGDILNAAVDGCIQMKSYLSGGPELKLALNADIVIRNEALSGDGSGVSSVRQAQYGSQAVQLDDCNFHDCVDLRDFECQRIMTIKPPDGEFVVMNYRITGEFRIPIRIRPVVEQTAPNKVENYGAKLMWF